MYKKICDEIFDDKVFCCLVSFLPVSVFFAIASRFFSSVYLPGWMLDHCMFCLAPVVIVLLINRKVAFWFSCYHVAAIIFGELLGEQIRRRNIAKITLDMDAGVVARMHEHPGFYIWFACVAAFILLVILWRCICIILKYTRTKKEEAGTI